ncbi:MAG: DEAD/DEAH box helicase [Candidatus Competibacter denitrificans]
MNKNFRIGSESGGEGHPLIVAPTGAGKSVIIAALIRNVLTNYPGSRIICLAHVKELLTQNLDKLLRIWPSAPVGVYSAGLNRRQADAPILFCGIQSVWNKAKALASHERPVELILIDEAHRVSLKEAGTYRRFLADLAAYNDSMRVIGLTATPYRYVSGTREMSGGYQALIEGEDRLFTDTVYDLSKDLSNLIGQDYLSALWPISADYQVETDDITLRNGDFAENELEARMIEKDAVDCILDESIALATQQERRHWLVFGVSVAHAQALTEGLMARGIRTGCITGSTPSLKRAHLIGDFQSGHLTALVSVAVLTTGFDAPVTDCLIMARPTKSPVLYTQIMGRGMRPTPEKIRLEADGRKRGCLVLDFCGNVERHGPLDGLRLNRPGPKKPEPLKTCPQCHADNVRLFAKTCPQCGYGFPASEPEPAIPTVNQRAIIAGIMPPTRYPVHRVSYAKHVGQSGVPTLRVDYYFGLQRIASEWVCLEHTGYARRKAEAWWRARADHQAPACVDEALQNLPSRQPLAVHVKDQGRWPEVVSVEGL